MLYQTALHREFVVQYSGDISMPAWSIKAKTILALNYDVPLPVIFTKFARFSRSMFVEILVNFSMYPGRTNQTTYTAPH